MLSSLLFDRGASALSSGASAALSSLCPWASLAGSPARRRTAASPAAARARAPSYVEAASRRSCAASSLGSCPRRGGPAFGLGCFVLLCQGVGALDALRWTRCGVCDVGAAFRGRAAIDFSPAHSGKAEPLPASAWPTLARNVLKVDPSRALRRAAERREAWGFSRKYPHVERILPQNARHARAHAAYCPIHRRHTCTAVNSYHQLYCRQP